MMTGNPPPCPAAAALTDLMLETFRLNGRLLAAGDRLVSDVGLTSARWQVLGAIALAGSPLPAAHIARRMGLTRQSVQRVVDDLHGAGMVVFSVNPHHRRAKLIGLSEAGQAAYAQAMARHDPWAEGLAEGLDAEEIRIAIEVLRTLAARLLKQEDKP
jgi:DNA-binding MarR family transcriptional regulator